MYHVTLYIALTLTSTFQNRISLAVNISEGFRRTGCSKHSCIEVGSPPVALSYSGIPSIHRYINPTSIGTLKMDIRPDDGDYPLVLPLADSFTHAHSCTFSPQFSKRIYAYASSFLYYLVVGRGTKYTNTSFRSSTNESYQNTTTQSV
jgi:hypothetical protein